MTREKKPPMLRPQVIDRRMKALRARRENLRETYRLRQEQVDHDILSLQERCEHDDMGHSIEGNDSVSTCLTCGKEW